MPQVRYLNERYTLALTEPRIKYKSVYVAQVTFMSGDADSYETQEWQFDTNEALIAFLDAIPSFYALNGSRRDGWGAKELDTAAYAHFEILTEAEYYAEKLHNDGDSVDYYVKYTKDYNDYLESVEIDWPRDNSCDGCGKAKFDGYQLYWYDEDGKESMVGVTVKGNDL